MAFHYNKTDAHNIEYYGKKQWEMMCDYHNDKAARSQRLLERASSKESMEKLFTLINQLLHDNLTFEYKVEIIRDVPYIKFKSCNIADRPVICYGWKEFTVSSFGGGIGTSESPYAYEKIDYSKPVEEVYYWMQIDFSYKSLSGGYNGVEIGDARFDEATDEWTASIIKS